MTVQWGDTGRVVFGPLKTYNVTLATPRETLLGSPLSLPTAEPANGSSGAQISFTIQQSDLPTINPSPIGLKYTAYVIVGGKNTDAATQTVSYHLYKNSTAVTASATQTGISTNYFWTQTHANFYDVKVGDVLNIGLWSSSANVNYDYYALIVVPTRMQLGNAYLNKDVNYSNFISANLTQGNPGISLNQSFNFYPTDSTSLSIQTATNFNFGALRWNQTYFSGRIQYGDNSTGSFNATHSTNRPYYAPNKLPGTITFREILR